MAATATLNTDHILSRSCNVSKLERLNTRVLKLLTAAVQEVLEVVKETVLEYQDKTARTLRENERLRLKLQDAQDQLEKEREVSRLATISPPVNHSFSEAHQNLEPLPTPPIKPDERTPTEDPVVKADAEPEAVCDLKVALTLADADPCRPEADVGTSSDMTVKNSEDGSRSSSILSCGVKTEPGPSECYADQPPIPHVVVTVTGDLRNQEHTEELGQDPTGVCVFPQTDVASEGRSLMNRWGVLGGLDRRHRENDHVCLACGKTFSRVGNLRIHQRCHTGEKPYRCPVCGHCFRQAGDLKKHKRVHTGEKPYRCMHCGKSFSRGENLKRHQKVHAGEKFRKQNVWKNPHGFL